MTVDLKTLFSQGLSALDSEDFGAAKADFEAVLALAPNTPEALSCLGFAEANLGAGDAALDHTAEAVGLAPGNVQVRLHRAFALKQDGQLDAAARELREANALSPGQPAILNQLARILETLELFSEAAAFSKELVQLQPKDPVAANRLVNCLIAAGQVAEALSISHALAKHFPDNHFLWALQARAAQEAGEWQTAQENYAKLVKHDPEDIAFKRGLALSLMELNSFEAAISTLKEIYQLDPTSTGVFYSFGFSYFNLHMFEQSRHFIDKALKVNPDHIDALVVKGRTLVFHGEIDQARSCFEKILELDPAHPMAHLQLAKMDPPKARTGAFDILETFNRELAGDSPQQALIGYALGDMYDAIKDYDTAFSNYTLGNSSALKAFTRIGAGFDEAELSAEFDRIKTLFSKDNLAAIDFPGATDARPIFIVAMPRSGTTLLEQIISAHTKVFGAGELVFANGMATTFFEDLTADTRDGLAETLQTGGDKYAKIYLDNLPKVAGRVDHISDKMPGNFRHLGLLQLVLPKARYIHIKRNPLDTCMSMYRGFFNRGFAYACDLYTLGLYYRHYAGLMEHWRAALPRPVLEISYEDLVTDSETLAPEILKFCGLSWEPGCLEYYKNKNKVITMSTYQVRKPINTSAIEKWRRYEKHLAPLFEGLGEDIVSTLDL